VSNFTPLGEQSIGCDEGALPEAPVDELEQQIRMAAGARELRDLADANRSEET
jgi:hypothetical protein